MSATDSPPNVLLIMTDQQRWDTVGAYGCPMDVTPHLDRLAHDGTRLEQAITAQPVCGSGKAVIQTGMYATETGVWRHSLPLTDDVRTIAHEFSDAGYETGFVGTWHLGATFDEPVPPERRGGYDDFWIGADIPEFISQPTEGILYDDDGEPVPFDSYRTDAFTAFACEALDALSEPFLLTVSFLEPHDQNDKQTFIAPDGYAERYENTAHVPPDLQDRPGNWLSELPDYYGLCERVDECVGRLLETLAEHGIRDRTLVAFTSDHGCHFRTRPGEYKRSCHESAVRVPAILNGPGVPAGETVDDVTSLVDLTPTLLDAAGLDVPARMHGESILSADADESNEADEPSVFIQISSSEIGRTIRTNRWKLSVSAPTLEGWRGGMSDPASDLYVERYLYDLARDPHERVNLAGRPDYRTTFDRLRNRLEEYIREVEGEEPEIAALSEPGYQRY